MLLLDCVIIFISGYLAKNCLGVLSYVLILAILPLVSVAIMIHEMLFGSNFLYYMAVMALTEVSSLSVWVFPAIYGEYKKVDLSMYAVIAIVISISLAFLAMAEVLPNDIIESLLRNIISKSGIYDIWSHPPYQLAQFFIVIGCFPYISAFVVSKTILKFRSYRFEKKQVI